MGKLAEILNAQTFMGGKMLRKFLGLLILITSLPLATCSNPSSDDPDDPDPAKGTVADLASLTVDSGTLNPAFTAEQTAYTVIAANTTNSITVSGTTADTNASMVISPTQPTQVSVGASAITVKVTAQDGVMTKEYTVIVYKNGPTPADYPSPSMMATLNLKGVPAGAFQRDSIVSNTSAVSAFRMSEKEITREQFTDILGTDPSVLPYTSGLNDPVQGLSWYAAIAFCNKLSLRDSMTPVYSVAGVNFATLTYADIPTLNNATWNAVSADWSASGYRLPTEMEWMWAAMGATAGPSGYTKSFAGSTGSNAIGDYAVFGYGGTETGSTTTERTNPVGSKLPNELGIFDLSGNVNELIWDWDANSQYPSGALEDYTGPSTGTQRLKHGGNWMEDASRCAVALGFGASTASGYMLTGFRVVRHYE